MRENDFTVQRLEAAANLSNQRILNNCQSLPKTAELAISDGARVNSLPEKAR